MDFGFGCQQARIADIEIPRHRSGEVFGEFLCLAKCQSKKLDKCGLACTPTAND